MSEEYGSFEELNRGPSLAEMEAAQGLSPMTERSCIIALLQELERTASNDQSRGAYAYAIERVVGLPGDE